MKALILAAGYATRLYPLTKKYPKPLLPVAGKPIINYIVEELNEIKGLKQIILVTNRRFYDNFIGWASNVKKITRIPVKIINDGTKNEGDRLGAIGDVDFVLKRERINGALLIIGGDNLFEDKLRLFLGFCLAHSPFAAIVAYKIKNRADAKKYGVISIGRDKRITSFEEKPEFPRSSLVATCLYYIPKERIECFKEYLSNPANEFDSAGSFIKWLSAREAVFAFTFKKKWYDIGALAAYKEADRVFSK